MSEVRTVSSLALLYAFRMLGLFMVLPVLMLYGDQYAGANSMSLGLALGIYGLTQACFQIPLGMLSDVVGRKPVIIGGLVIFAIGSVVAAISTSIEGLIVGRALQGSGAIASAIMAMVADLTSEQNRTKAMAAIGASIGLSFSLAMMLGPALAAIGGLDAIFLVAALLAGLGIALVLFVVPRPQKAAFHRDILITPALVKKSVRNAQLMRLNWGIFSLHCMLMAIFVGLPGDLELHVNLAKENHWQFYLPLLLLAFIAMLPLMLYAEKKKKVRSVFIAAVGMLSFSCLALALPLGSSLVLVIPMLMFFIAFNLLEAMLPSLVSKIAPVGTKGTALGIYSTSQFAGAFIGGLVGGLLLQLYSSQAVFGFAGIVGATWLIFAWTMAAPRDLTSLCVAVESREDADKVARVAGVVEAFHAVDESRVYLKVDREHLDERALREHTRSRLDRIGVGLQRADEKVDRMSIQPSKHPVKRGRESWPEV